MKKAIFFFSFVMVLFPIATAAQAADRDAENSALAPPSLLGALPGAGSMPAQPPTGAERPSLDLTNPGVAANTADLSLDGLMSAPAREAEQAAALDQALQPGALAPAGETTTPQLNPQAQIAAVGATAQEAAMLGVGAPVGTEGEGAEEHPGHDMTQCFNLFREFTGIGFQELSQGLESGNLPPGVTPEMAQGMIRNFNDVHERFEQLSAQFGQVAFGEAGHLPGLPAGAPMGGPEGMMMPAFVSFQDMGTVFGAALAGVDPARFAEGISQMMEARQEAFQNFFQQGNFDPQAMSPEMAANMPNLADFSGAGEFLSQFGGQANMPFQFGAEAGNFMGPMAQNDMSAMPADFANFLAQLGSTGDFNPQDVAAAIAQSITGDIIQQGINQRFGEILGLTPETLKLIAALNTDFTGTDLTTLGGGAPSIVRAFDADLANYYKGKDYPGNEHIHVTYTLTGGGGDGLVPYQHVDAQVTAIHSADHDPAKDVDLAQETGEEHIPGIVA